MKLRASAARAADESMDGWDDFDDEDGWDDAVRSPTQSHVVSTPISPPTQPACYRQPQQHAAPHHSAASSSSLSGGPAPARGKRLLRLVVLLSALAITLTFIRPLTFTAASPSQPLTHGGRQQSVEHATPGSLQARQASAHDGVQDTPTIESAGSRAARLPPTFAAPHGEDRANGGGGAALHGRNDVSARSIPPTSTASSDDVASCRT